MILALKKAFSKKASRKKASKTCSVCPLSRKLSGVVLLLSLVSACTASDPSAQKLARQATREAERRLTMGVSADYPPFEFKKTGEIMGFDVDLAREIVQTLGYSLVIQDMDFSGLIPALQSGRIDFAMSGMTVTEERKKNLNFSETYFTSSFAAIFPKLSSIHELKDLNGKKIGAQLGSTMEKFCKERLENVHTVALAKNPVLIQELKSGRLDAVITEDIQAAEFVEANPTLTYTKLTSTGDGYAVAFSKDGSGELQNSFNQVLQKLTANGVVDQLKKKWLERKAP